MILGKEGTTGNVAGSVVTRFPTGAFKPPAREITDGGVT